MIIDLHLHSTYSDGKFKPAEVARRVAKAGIKIAALTDHDTIDGTNEFNHAAKKLGITPINGVEFTVYQEDIGLHILGLGINIENQSLRRIFAEQIKERKNSFFKTVKLFQKAGLMIDQKKFRHLKKLKTIAKPHIFDLIYGVPQNKELLKKKYGFYEGERPMGDFIDQLMSFPGQIAYVKKNGLVCGEAIKAIHQAGGMAILAHPGIEIEFRNERKDIIKTIRDLVKDGLDGLEVFSCAFDHGESAGFHKIAKESKLIATVGSDDHDGFRIGTVKTKLKLEKELVEYLVNKKHLAVL